MRESLEERLFGNDIIKCLINLADIDLLIAFNDNHLIELCTVENKRYIPLFTALDQLSGLNYTKIDSVKLETVIKDIYSLGYYHAIAINPFTTDFIMNEKLIKIFFVINKYKL